MLRRTAALLFVFLACSPLAAQDEPGLQVELFGASVHLYDEGEQANDQMYGLRGAYRFTARWAVEAALAKLDDDEADAYVGDLSARYTFARLERFSLYAVAGPGLIRVQLDDEDFDVDEDTYHFGLGAEIPLGEKGYLRPDVRGRRYVDSNIDGTLVDYSVGFGWRF